jgi:hypothetical protein
MATIQRKSREPVQQPAPPPPSTMIDRVDEFQAQENAARQQREREIKRLQFALYIMRRAMTMLNRQCAKAQNQRRASGIKRAGDGFMPEYLDDVAKRFIACTETAIPQETK